MFPASGTQRAVILNQPTKPESEHFSLLPSCYTKIHSRQSHFTIVSEISPFLRSHYYLFSFYISKICLITGFAHFRLVAKNDYKLCFGILDTEDSSSLWQFFNVSMMMMMWSGVSDAQSFMDTILSLIFSAREFGFSQYQEVHVCSM